MSWPPTAEEREHLLGDDSDRERAAWDEGVRQAMAWLQADYPYGTGPEWREHGVEWIADRLAEHRADRIKGGVA